MLSNIPAQSTQTYTDNYKKQHGLPIIQIERLKKKSKNRIF